MCHCGLGSMTDEGLCSLMRRVETSTWTQRHKAFLYCNNDNLCFTLVFFRAAIIPGIVFSFCNAHQKSQLASCMDSNPPFDSVEQSDYNNTGLRSKVFTPFYYFIPPLFYVLSSRLMAVRLVGIILAQSSKPINHSVCIFYSFSISFRVASLL